MSTFGRPRLSLRDAASESVAGLLARPGRSFLTVLGTVLGVGALVATLGVSKTAGNQIVGRFDELAATSVVAQAQTTGFGTSRALVNLPWDAADRLARLNGVVAAGTSAEVDVRGDLVSSVPVNDPLGQTEFQMTIVAASPGLVDAVRGDVGTGRWFDAGHSERADRVAVLGIGAAQRLNITRVDQQPAIFVGDTSFAVIGILADVLREPTLLNAVIIPEGTAREIYELAAPAQVNIDTEVGAASLIASQAAIALHPDDPALIQVQKPPEPEEVRATVESDVNSLFLVLGGVSLLVGAIGIANVTLVSVLERVGEIGLRRAVGAARRHIAGQFLLESTGMGIVGGIVGASVGVLVVVAVSASRTWTPVLDPWIPVAAPILGGLTGLLAGIYPALRAASLEPVEALRHGA